MTAFIIQILIVLVTWYHSTNAYEIGAPSIVCGLTESMEPFHSENSRQTTPSRYRLTVKSNQTTYKSGENITIILSEPRVISFRGFLVQASTSQAVVGEMVAHDGTKFIACGANDRGGITHTSKRDKISITFSWIAPDTSSGPISFYVTIVQDFMTFWVNEKLLTLTPDTPIVDLQQAHHLFLKQQQLQAAREGIVYDNQCGSRKGCFVDCKSNNCEFMVTWRDTGSAIQFELSGKSSPTFHDGWMAIGFSADTRMGDDSVTECIYSIHNEITEVRVFSSFNNGFSNRRLNPQSGLENIAGHYMDGVFRCSFSQNKYNAQTEMFNLDKDWNLMFAHGRAFPTWSINKHIELPKVSASKVDFQSFAVIGSSVKFPLVKAHGCLMILAWVLFTGIGIFVARYYKPVWSDRTFLKMKIWFQIHRVCMVSALTLDLIAFIIIFVESRGYSQIPDISSKGYLRSHPVLGIIITGLCVANPVLALFRCAPNDAKRPIFNWAHWTVGMAAYVLSAICICFGFELGKSSTPNYAVYIMISYILYIILFDIIFEVVQFTNDKKNKVPPKSDVIELSNKNGTDNGTIPNGNHPTKDRTEKIDKIKTMMLVIHIAFTGTFTLILILVVALN